MSRVVGWRGASEASAIDSRENRAEFRHRDSVATEALRTKDPSLEEKDGKIKREEEGKQKQKKQAKANKGSCISRIEKYRKERRVQKRKTGRHS